MVILDRLRSCAVPGAQVLGVHQRVGIAAEQVDRTGERRLAASSVWLSQSRRSSRTTASSSARHPGGRSAASPPIPSISWASWSSGRWSTGGNGRRQVRRRVGRQQQRTRNGGAAIAAVTGQPVGDERAHAVAEEDVRHAQVGAELAIEVGDELVDRDEARLPHPPFAARQQDRPDRRARGQRALPVLVQGGTAARMVEAEQRWRRALARHRGKRS